MSHPPSQGPHESPQPHGPPQEGQVPQGPPPEGPPPQGPPHGHPAGPYQPGPPPPPPGQPPYGHPQGGHPYAPGQPPYGPGQPPYGPGQPPYGPGQPPYGPPQGSGGGMSKGAKIGLIGGSAALAVVLVAGIVIVATDPFSSDDPPSASAEDEQDTEEEDGTDDDATGGGGPGAEVYEGGRNELIELDEPLTGPRFMSIESDGAVTVELRDAEGDQVDQVDSSYTGSGGKAPYNHRYGEEITQLDVRSDEESWTISDEPLENADTWDDPDEPLEGSGSDVVLIDWESTDVEIEMEHSGESNFAIWAHNIDEDGFSDLLVNEIGEYTGSEAMSEDTAFLHVEADGDWTLSPA